jgi:hypothetical protein
MAKTSIAKTSIAKTSMAKTSIAKTSMAETSITKTSMTKSSIPKTNTSIPNGWESCNDRGSLDGGCWGCRRCGYNSRTNTIGESSSSQQKLRISISTDTSNQGSQDLERSKFYSG